MRVSANTSVIESIFGEQRAMGNENAQGFSKGVLLIDLTEACHSLDTMKTYAASDAKTGDMGNDLDPAIAAKMYQEIWQRRT